MPRASDRELALANLFAAYEDAVTWEVILDEDMADEMDAVEDELIRILSSRYLNPRVQVPRAPSRIDWLLNHLDDQRFKQELRMQRESFQQLVGLLEGHPVFQTRAGRMRQAPVSHQLAVALTRFGTFGNGVSVGRVSRAFSIAEGTAVKYTERVTIALLALWDRVVSWPDADRRGAIKAVVHGAHGLPECVGFVDGTLFPLSHRPTANGEDYFDRKSNYSLNAMVICQHDRRISYVFTGVPGSYHDQRVFNLSAFGQGDALAGMFNGQEYILADSAYTATTTCIPVIKKPSNAQLAPKQVAFNQVAASARVVVEHTIGLLKMRWQSLRGLPMPIHGPSDVRKAVRWVMACVVLHNMLLHEHANAEDFDGYEPEDATAILRQANNQGNGAAGNHRRGARMTPGILKRNALVDYVHTHRRFA